MAETKATLEISPSTSTDTAASRSSSNPRPDLTITKIEAKDIDAAIKTIQLAFADDPFASWIYDQSKFSPKRNHASLTIRMKWGMRNGHIYVAHTPERRCAGVAMWVGPKPLDAKRTWDDRFQDWLLWWKQVGMNTRYGRGGLQVDVSCFLPRPSPVLFSIDPLFRKFLPSSFEVSKSLGLSWTVRFCFSLFVVPRFLPFSGWRARFWGVFGGFREHAGMLMYKTSVLWRKRYTSCRQNGRATKTPRRV